MRRAITVICLGALAVALAAILGGCGGSASGEEEAAPADTPAGSGAEVLAVQTGSDASIRHREGDTYELTIDRPSARTLYFTDSPERRVRTAPVGRLARWVKSRTAKQGYPANIALSWNADGASGSLAAALTGIEYESDSGHLRATLDLLKTGNGAPASVEDGELGLTRFSDSSVSMVFDAYGNNRCFARIYTPSDTFWELESSSVEHNDWGRAPPQTIGHESIVGAVSTSEWLGCEFKVTYGDGEGSGFTIWVDNPWAGSAKYSCQGFGKASCSAETQYRTQYNEAFLQADVGYSG